MSDTNWRDILRDAARFTAVRLTARAGEVHAGRGQGLGVDPPFADPALYPLLELTPSELATAELPHWREVRERRAREEHSPAVAEALIAEGRRRAFRVVRPREDAPTPAPTITPPRIPDAPAP